MRWMCIKEGYQRKQVWLNIDQLVHIRFSTGSDGQPMAYLTGSDQAEFTTHEAEDLDKLHHVLKRNEC